MMVLALTLVSGMAAAQGAPWTQAGGSPTPRPPLQSFSLGGDTAYTIGPISWVDAARLQEMGVPLVTLPAGATAYVAYSTGVPAAPGSNTDRARMVVFGPNGFVGAGAWPGAGGAAQTYSLSGTRDQYFLVRQVAGGTGDIVVVGFV
jgi:hypothetical protein